jgi:hypothetical protein
MADGELERAVLNRVEAEVEKIKSRFDEELQIETSGIAAKVRRVSC